MHLKPHFVRPLCRDTTSFHLSTTSCSCSVQNVDPGSCENSKPMSPRHPDLRRTSKGVVSDRAYRALRPLTKASETEFVSFRIAKIRSFVKIKTTIDDLRLNGGVDFSGRQPGSRACQFCQPSLSISTFHPFDFCASTDSWSNKQLYSIPSISASWRDTNIT